VQIITEISPFISENNLGQPPYKSEFLQVRFDTEPRLLFVFDLVLLNLQNTHFKSDLAQREILLWKNYPGASTIFFKGFLQFSNSGST
jgi:hypothetical protein